MNTEDYTIILKEWIMQFGLYEITACVVVVVTIWRLPNVIHAITEYRKIGRKHNER